MAFAHTPARRFAPRPGRWRTLAENEDGPFDSYAPEEFKYTITASEV